MNTDGETQWESGETVTGDEQTHNLQLNTEVLQEEGNVSTSLCDRFGIHMYSPEFLEKESQYKEEQNQEKTDIFYAVMHNSKNEKTEESFQRVIRAEKVEVIKADYMYNDQNSPVWIPAAYGLLGAFLAGVILFFIDRVRRKRHEDNPYNTK
nr:hypothetical protein [uncultured Mediterraneibacter sp.]